MSLCVCTMLYSSPLHINVTTCRDLKKSYVHVRGLVYVFVVLDTILQFFIMYEKLKIIF